MNFKIEQSTDSKFSAVVYALNFESPFEDIQLLNKNLLWSGINHSIVLFDLLLCNGKGYNRFVTMTFNGKNLNLKSFKILTKISQEIKLQSLQFFKTCNLENSILSEYDRNSLIEKCQTDTASNGNDAILVKPSNQNYENI